MQKSSEVQPAFNDIIPGNFSKKEALEAGIGLAISLIVAHIGLKMRRRYKSYQRTFDPPPPIEVDPGSMNRNPKEPTTEDLERLGWNKIGTNLYIQGDIYSMDMGGDGYEIKTTTGSTYIIKGIRVVHVNGNILGECKM